MSDRRQREGGGLAVYVTSHGFGHMNRTVAVLNRVPAGVPLLIRCHSNLFENWRERLKRPAELEHYVSDVGAINPPGDSAATDQAATLEQAEQLHAHAMAQLDEQVSKLKEAGTSAVLCDAPAVPLVAARRAELPGYLMSNFTWADIYAPYARAQGGEWMRFVADLRACYRHATATFRVAPAMSMSWLSPVIAAGMIVNQGFDRSRGAAPAPAIEADRQVGLPLHRPLRPERPRLVASGAIRPRQRPLCELLRTARR